MATAKLLGHSMYSTIDLDPANMGGAKQLVRGGEAVTVNQDQARWLAFQYGPDVEIEGAQSAVEEGIMAREAKQTVLPEPGAKPPKGGVREGSVDLSKLDG